MSRQTTSRYPETFQRGVLERYMNADELKDFFERYRENLKHVGGRGVPEPTQNDIRITSHVRKTKNYTETAKALNITTYKVISSVSRVSAWEK